MQITNSIVCGTSKGCIYKQIKPPLVGEHAFPLTGFVCRTAHVTVITEEEIRNVFKKYISSSSELLCNNSLFGGQL